jgi:hypothetical protein
MLDIIEIVHINQRLAYVYITIIGQLNVDEQMMELDTVPSSAFPQISAGCFV